ncbi:hypothetical protein DP939_23280 [Spongiactinospora rosea]|uniref:DeoxyPurine in DNA protein A domain-containing protein n=1 Tax=Spongiactinospora rosea TaxID=2248750 RepID=A0A366LV11_9ACTN|nr:hypothetical protein [Spongiactinospora rosea]RBQ17786.1 hypothetical protein DP939_23280 [Spongiactinospora rosea]
MVFYLGTHMPHWLERVAFPLFVSHRQLSRRPRRRPLIARCRWALDSGGFTELALHGRWTIPPDAYAEAVAGYADTIGQLDFAAPQDWMCEPVMLERTGLSITEHQHRTVANYLHLRAIAPDLPFIPVLQGWQLADYLHCADLYASAGVNLASLPRVGLGSVCRRQSTTEIARIVATLAHIGLRLHGFGVKTGGLHRYGQHLASADSLAWSFAARREPPLPGHTHKNCANCLTYAASWRERILTRLHTTPRQPELPGIDGEPPTWKAA